jgi:ribosome-associated protein
VARACFRALAEKKAGDIRAIDVSGVSSITNFLVIGTATSEPHVRALRIELEKALDGSQTHIVGIETSADSGWTVVDAFDVMVHVFTAENREHYRLEHLWRDGTELSEAELFSDPPRKAAAKKPAARKKVPATRKAPSRKPKKRS